MKKKLLWGIERWRLWAMGTIFLVYGILLTFAAHSYYMYLITIYGQ